MHEAKRGWGSCWALVAIVACGCGAKTDQTSLLVEFDPKQLANDGTTATVRVAATDANGDVGSGAVELTAEAGTLGETTLTIDRYGTARTSYSCNVTTDPACNGRVKVTAKWRAPSGNISADGSVTLAPPAAPATGLIAAGCTKIATDRPSSTGSLASPRVGAATLPPVVPGRPFVGSLSFADDQNDESQVIAQLNGEMAHYLCPLAAGELSTHAIDLARLSLGVGQAPGESLLYVGIKDRAGNISGYVTVTLVVGVGGGLELCGPRSAVQLTGSAASASTQFYTTVNGTLPSYGLGSRTGEHLTIVYRAVTKLNTSGCTHLFVSADAAGTKPAGWDNCLLIEVREQSGGPITTQWAYCDGPDLINVATGLPVRKPLSPSIPGDQLVPPVPSSLSFGFPARAIDLMSEIPAGLSSFELSLYVLDFGAVGSTTEVWMLPR